MLQSATRPKLSSCASRAGRHAARIKCNRYKLIRHKDGQHEYNNVKSDQQQRQPNFEHRAQHRDHEEQADTNRHRPDQDRIGNGRHLLGQNLQIGFCDRDQDTDQQRDANDCKQVFGARQLRADALAHRCHRHIRAQLKKSHTDDQQHRTGQEHHQCTNRHGRDRHTEQQHDQCDRYDRGQRFLYFFLEDFVHSRPPIHYNLCLSYLLYHA